MSEVYWIAGAHNWEPSESIDTWLLRTGLKPAWIDEIFWLSQPGDSVISNLPDRTNQWNLDGPAAHRLLQLILSDLLCGKNDLILLVEGPGQTISLAALATPQAIGRYNLLPAGRLAALNGLHQGQSSQEATKAVQINLTQMELEPESVGCYTMPSELNINLAGIFPSAQMVDLSNGAGLIETILAMLEVLKNRPEKAGLLFDGDAPLATLLEAL